MIAAIGSALCMNSGKGIVLARLGLVLGTDFSVPSDHREGLGNERVHPTILLRPDAVSRLPSGFRAWVGGTW